MASRASEDGRVIGVNTEGDSAERLSVSVHLAVGQICEQTGMKSGVVFSREVIGAITNLALNQSSVIARDLEQFAKHAKRATINIDDVKLLVRRNEALGKCLDTVIDRLHPDGDGKVVRKRKRRRVDEADVDDVVAEQNVREVEGI